MLVLVPFHPTHDRVCDDIWMETILKRNSIGWLMRSLFTLCLYVQLLESTFYLMVQLGWACDGVTYLSTNSHHITVYGYLHKTFASSTCVQYRPRCSCLFHSPFIDKWFRKCNDHLIFGNCEYVTTKNSVRLKQHAWIFKCWIAWIKLYHTVYLRCGLAYWVTHTTVAPDLYLTTLSVTINFVS